MFTGIIKQIGQVKEIQGQVGSRKLGLELDLANQKLNIGDSLSLNGVCLTVVEIKDKIAFFDIVPESLNKSNLSLLKIGDKLNIEFSLKANDSLSGHFVSGHIDCMASIKTKRKESGSTYFEISIPKEFSKFIAPKGSIAVNGISLTIVEASKNYFSFYAIPHSLNYTTLRNLKINDKVNIEFDILAKYVDRILTPQRPSSDITRQFLKEKGFI